MSPLLHFIQDFIHQAIEVCLLLKSAHNALPICKSRFEVRRHFLQTLKAHLCSMHGNRCFLPPQCFYFIHVAALTHYVVPQMVTRGSVGHSILKTNSTKLVHRERFLQTYVCSSPDRDKLRKNSWAGFGHQLNVTCMTENGKQIASLFKFNRLDTMFTEYYVDPFDVNIYMKHVNMCIKWVHTL